MCARRGVHPPEPLRSPTQTLGIRPCRRVRGQRGSLVRALRSSSIARDAASGRVLSGELRGPSLRVLAAAPPAAPRALVPRAGNSCRVSSRPPWVRAASKPAPGPRLHSVLRLLGEKPGTEFRFLLRAAGQRQRQRRALRPIHAHPARARSAPQQMSAASSSGWPPSAAALPIRRRLNLNVRRRTGCGPCTRPNRRRVALRWRPGCCKKTARRGRSAAGS
jgi:hypothetical protein